MNNILKGGKNRKLMGIYKIENINNGKVYVGSSKNIEVRIKQHFSALEKNKHHSVKLQRSYNATKDKSAFQFSVVEEVADERQLKEHEQYYIDLYNAYNKGYNCTALVDNPRYSNKRIKKRERQKKKIQEFGRFIEIYEQYKDRVEFGCVFLSRLLEMHYSHYTYCKVSEMILWLIENYDESYCGSFSAYNQKIFIGIYKKGENTILIHYQYDKGKMILTN